MVNISWLYLISSLVLVGVTLAAVVVLSAGERGELPVITPPDENESPENGEVKFRMEDVVLRLHDGVASVAAVGEAFRVGGIGFKWPRSASFVRVKAM